MSTEDQSSSAEPSSAACADEDALRGEPRLSDSLSALAADQSREHISLNDVLAAVQDRAFGALLFIFSVPNVIPTPPGTSFILGTPLVLLSAQLMLGRTAPWLPKTLARRSMAQTDFAGLMRRVIPWVIRAERVSKPRLSVLARRPYEQLVGAVCLIMAVVLVLPIPLGNIPPAIALCLFALGVLERDGVAILLGLALAIASLAIVSGVLVAMVAAAIFVLTETFGLSLPL